MPPSLLGLSLPKHKKENRIMTLYYYITKNEEVKEARQIKIYSSKQCGVKRGLPGGGGGGVG